MTAARAPDGLLRPALQLAVDAARAGAGASPPVEPPRRLRPILHFTKLPDSALATVRRVLEHDEAFRARVGELADDTVLGRAGWLFLVRPEGWEEELSGLAGEAERRAAAERDEREERSARRRLASAEAKIERAERAAAGARAGAEAAAAELAAERRERRAASDEAVRLARRVASLEGERDSARRVAAKATADAEALRAELASVRARMEADATEAALLRAPPSPPPEPSPPFDVEGAAAAVAAASTAATALGRALADASAALGGVAAPPPAASDPGPVAEAPPPATSRAPASRRRRRPPALPPGMHDDTAEAAAHLVRVPGVLVMVDGYNAAKALWPDLGPAELRQRLVDALAELEARTGAAIHAVFDGADLGGTLPRRGGRRRVRVSFSPAGVEADDVILELLDGEPVAKVVVVATSDRRVQDGARARGAAVISSAQLASVLRRA